MQILDQQPTLKKLMTPLMGLILSTGLLMASLWQIEIAVALPGEEFSFPFYILTVNKWWIRDFWYLVNILSWLLGILSTAALVNLHNQSLNK
jgi:hypothetical protein